VFGRRGAGTRAFGRGSHRRHVRFAQRLAWWRAFSLRRAIRGREKTKPCAELVSRHLCEVRSCRHGHRDPQRTAARAARPISVQRNLDERPAGRPTQPRVCRNARVQPSRNCRAARRTDDVQLLLRSAASQVLNRPQRIASRRGDARAAAGLTGVLHVLWPIARECMSASSSRSRSVLLDCCPRAEPVVCLAQSRSFWSSPAADASEPRVDERCRA
jgi:hypothetical protein